VSKKVFTRKVVHDGSVNLSEQCLQLASSPGSCARMKKKETLEHTVFACAKFPW